MRWSKQNHVWNDKQINRLIDIKTETITTKWIKKVFLNFILKH